MTKQEHQKILDEISKSRIEYRKKFKKDYAFDIEASLDVAYILADLKDCIENNHLQERGKNPRPDDWD